MTLDATQPLTVLAEIEPARAQALPGILETVAVDLAAQLDLPDTHFMRLLIIDDAQRQLAPILAWESNYDGPLDDYLAAILAAVPRLDAAFACCVDYPGAADPDARVRWLRARTHHAAAFYTGYRGVQRRQVVNDDRLHTALREAADRERKSLGKKSPAAVQRLLVESVRAAHPELETSDPGDDELRWTVSQALALLAILAVLPIVLVLAGPWYLLLRRREASDVPDVDPRPVWDDGDHHDHEDQDGVAQNQLTHLVDIKPGWFSLATVWIVLTVIDLAARVYFVRGNLGGITDIHFARWVIVLDRRDGIAPAQRRHRLLFFSNYDGSWESYLGEFVDRASSGLTAVWSNTRGFPRTQNLVGLGSRDEEAFKQWARSHQVHTEAWWPGPRGSTVQNVRDDVTLRRGFAKPATDDDAARRWLELL